MNLNRKHFAELFRADYITVAVTFNSTKAGYGSYNKQYTYKLPKGATINVGDQLVVYVKDRQNDNPLQITTVREVHANPEINSSASFNYKWAVGRLENVMDECNANTARDNQLKMAVEKLEVALTRVDLKKQLAAAMTELDPATIAELSMAFGQDFTQMAIESQK